MTTPSTMRDHILSTASALFYEHGLRAVGIDLVIKEADIAKATLYRHFPTKEDLIIAYLAGRQANALREMRNAADESGDNPGERILAIFHRLARVAKNGFRGCAFIRAQAEHLESEPIHAAVKQHKEAVRQLFFDLLTPAIRSARQRHDTAATLALIYDGALAVAMVQKDAKAVRLAVHAASLVVQAATSHAVPV